MRSKSEYPNDFWRSCDTEDCRNDAENSALIIGLNYIFKNVCNYSKCFMFVAQYSNPFNKIKSP